jgi:ribosomal protein L22
MTPDYLSIPRHEITQGVCVPKQRHGTQTGHSFPEIQWWRWSCQPSKTVQGDTRYHLPSRFSRKVNSRYFIGRWPEKSVKFITRLLKNAESNADAKNLELENLVIRNIVVQQAPVC